MISNLNFYNILIACVRKILSPFLTLAYEKKSQII